MSLKVLFLDIDGCLNNFYKIVPPEGRKGKKDSLEWYSYDIDRNCVGFLNQILQETGAKVVLSSAWRIKFSPKEMTKILKYHKFLGEIIDSTPKKLSYVDRGTEIKWWLESYREETNIEIKDFVIVDDNYFHGFDYWKLADRFVHIEDHLGLKHEHAEMAIKILNKGD